MTFPYTFPLSFQNEPTNWLSGWAKRIKLTIDGSKVDSALNYFPLMVKISTASGLLSTDISRVFDDLGANSLKIAVTKDDGLSQLYVEIEKWDNAGEEAILWVSKNDFVVINDTVLYLYYDSTHADNSTFVGVVGSTQGNAVWDANFVLVDHMADNPDTSHTKDSTVNANNGTKKGANEPIKTTSGKIGDAQDFAGDDDSNNYSNGATLALTNSLTLEAIIKPDSGIVATKSILSKQQSSTGGYYLDILSGYNINFGLAGMTPIGLSSTVVLTAETWNYVAGDYDIAPNLRKITVNTTVKSDTPVGTIGTTANNLYAGRYSNSGSQYFPGIIDEVRISNIARSTVWIKASYYSNFDSLISYSIESFPVTDTSLIAKIAFGSTPLSTSPVWDFIQSDIREIHPSRGRNHDLDRMEPGTLDIVLDNESCNYFPDNTLGTYYPNVKTMKKISIQVVYDGTVYDIFTGFIESYNPSYLSGGGFGNLMTLHCVGILGKILSLQSLNIASGYPAEQSGVRVGKVLTDCGVPSGWQTLDAGQDTFASTGALNNTNALSHLYSCQESELSLIYESPSGNVIFEDRSHRTPLVSVASFGDTASDIGYTDIQYNLDETLLFNDVRITGATGSVQIATSSTSIANYGKRTYAKTTLHSSESQAAKLGVYVIARYANTSGRINSIVITPDSSDKWVQCLARNLSDRVTIRNSDIVIDNDYFIEGIQYDWDFVNGSFQTTFQLSDAELYLTRPDAQGEKLIPNATGSLTECFAFPSSSPNWECVNDSATTDYVYSTAIGGGGELKDVYSIPNPTYQTGSVNYVRVESYCKSVDDGAGGAAFVPALILTHSTEYTTTTDTVNTTWASYSYVWTTNPYTSTGWTISEINDLQVGVKLRRNAVSGKARCAWVYASVNITPGW